MATFYRCDRCLSEMKEHTRTEVTIHIKVCASADDNYKFNPTQDFCSDCVRELNSFLRTSPSRIK